jgi:hypothetical protein
MMPAPKICPKPCPEVKPANPRPSRRADPRLGKLVVSGIVEIGRKLVEVKERVGRG